MLLTEPGRHCPVGCPRCRRRLRPRGRFPPHRHQPPVLGCSRHAGPISTLILDELVDTVDGVRSTILASVDGFGLARSRSMGDEASHPAMLAAAVGLAHQLVAMSGGDRLRQLVVDHDGGLLLVWPIGEQRVLAVLASPTVEQRNARSFVRARHAALSGVNRECPDLQDPRHRAVRGRQDVDDPVGVADPGDLHRCGHQRRRTDVKSHTTVAMDFGTYCLDGDDTRLLLFGTPGQARFRFMTNILKGDVDVVAFVIDAEATETHAGAGVELRALLRDLRVPAVIAVNRCDDLTIAARLARSLGALDGEAVVPCQLIDPDSGREVVVEILLTLLASMEHSKAEVA